MSLKSKIKNSFWILSGTSALFFSNAFADCLLSNPLNIGVSDPRTGVSLSHVTFDQEILTDEVAAKENGSYQMSLFRIFDQLSPNASTPTEGLGANVASASAPLMTVGFGGAYFPGFNGSTRSSDADGNSVFETVESDGGNSVRAVMKGSVLLSLSLGLPVGKQIEPGVFERTGTIQKLCVTSAQLAP